MSRLLPKLAGIAAAAAVVLSVGVGSAAANVTRYHESDGTVVSINTPNVATTVGTQTHAQVTVSVSGPSRLDIYGEGFLTASRWVGGGWDGLRLVSYGCLGNLYSGQSCTEAITFTPTFVGTHSETYVLLTLEGANEDPVTLYANFAATGLRPSPSGAIAPNSGLLAP